MTRMVAAIAVLFSALQVANPMAHISREYVRLVLALGEHDKDYVDAYYGPDEIKADAVRAKLSLDDIGKSVTALSDSLARVPAAGDDELSQLRHQYLAKQLAAMSARVRMLKGEHLSFDEESKALYDAVAPTNTEALVDPFDGLGDLRSRSSHATTRGADTSSVRATSSIPCSRRRLRHAASRR